MIDRLLANPNYDASKRLLDAAALRQEAIASNIANAETPGYKRVDLEASFASEFAARFKAGNVASAPSPRVVEDAAASSQRADGNTVEVDKELLAMGKNGAEFEVLTDFVSGSLKQLRMAITGRSY